MCPNLTFNKRIMWGLITLGARFVYCIGRKDLDYFHGNGQVKAR